MRDSLPEVPPLSVSEDGPRTTARGRGRAEQVSHIFRDMMSPRGRGRWNRRPQDRSRGGPKTPILQHGQEMGRIEGILSAAASPQNNQQIHETSATNPTAEMNSAPPNYQGTATEAALPSTGTESETSQTNNMDIESQERTGGAEKQQRWWERPRWKALRSRLWTLLFAFIFLVLVVSIYLGLALTKQLNLRQEWHVLLILIILVATLFFCHSLIRLCIDATRPMRSHSSGNLSRIPSIAGPGGYAMPREPIRINTQNPEAVEALKEPPPVYGLWRCSVRVNPDQFYWVRQHSSGPSSGPSSGQDAIREEQESDGSSGTSRRDTLPRPPSYASDDGVSYAVNIVPERPEPPLPPHPSELCRHS